MDTTIEVMVNGQACIVPARHSVGSLIEERGLTGKRVAVELNGAIVPRSRHTSTTLADADRLEIVVAVGGG